MKSTQDNLSTGANIKKSKAKSHIKTDKHKNLGTMSKLDKHIKFDLHSHTTNSDGQLTTIELLQKAQRNQIDLLSITDHGSVNSYFEIKKLDIKKFYTGKLITGCEMYSVFNGKGIEILAYGADVKELNVYIEKWHSAQWHKNKKDDVVKTLMAAAKNLNLTFDENYKIQDYSRGESSGFLKHLKQFPENKQAFSEAAWNNSKVFFREELNNKNSPFFIDYKKYYPSPKEVVKAIHNCGGKAFLAHFYIYKYKNTRQTLNSFVKTSNIDGIECYYSTFSKRNVSFLLKYCQEHNLLVSGGSDFHGKRRPACQLGTPSKHIKASPSHLHWTKPYLF